MWEERKERSNKGGQASNHDEAKPPGSKPAIIALDKVRRSTWSNLPLRPRSKMPKDFETKAKVCKDFKTKATMFKNLEQHTV